MTDACGTSYTPSPYHNSETVDEIGQEVHVLGFPTILMFVTARRVQDLCYLDVTCTKT
jgi:hypothetical protein